MTRDGWLALVLFVLVGAAVLQARAWDIKAALFPTVIGLAVLGLLALQVAASIQQARSSLTRAVSAPGENANDPAERRRIVSIVAWLAGFAALVWVLGFPIGGTVGTLLYLVFTARERLPMVAGITAGTALFFYLSVVQLNVPYPRGALFDALGLPFL